MSAVLERDEHDLNEVGLSVAEVVSAAADFIRRHPSYRALSFANALSASEEGFLKRAGALGVGEEADLDEFKATIKESALEFAQMVASSWSSGQVAEHLDVSKSRVRQRTDAKTLYSINTPRGRVYPSWQFTELDNPNSKSKNKKIGITIPGLEEVLPLLRDDAHPIGVQRFFLNPQCDLEDELCGKLVQFNPIDWLETGHSVADVKRIVEFI